MTTHRNIPTMKRKAVSLLGAFAILALAVPAMNSTASAQTESPANNGGLSSPIEGSWIFTIVRINQHGFRFTALASFTAVGVFLASGSIDGLNPISPLHGTWQRTHPNRFDSTTYFFAFDPAGNAVAMIKTNQTFQLNSRNELVGSGVGFACDLQGQNCVSVPEVSIQITGRRIEPESL
jgi:hypothetical protein